MLRKLHASFCIALFATLAAPSHSEERIFSGPQPGERVTPFKVIDVRGDSAGKERELAAEKDAGPVVLVFVHGVERSIVPLLATVDQYGAEKKDALKSTFVFLSGDRVASEKHLPLVGQSLRLQCPMTLSPDGLEGPGNYGLNKNCLMTILVAKEGRVTANFALVQPGIADAPAVIRAMAAAVGDADPPTADALRQRRAEAAGEDGTRMRRGAATRPAGAQLPGAAPTDQKLIALLRRFIQRTNDDAAVDQVVAEVEQYVAGHPTLARQAIDGWTRVLHLKYGTEYAQKAGQQMIDRLRDKKPDDAK